MDKKDKEAFINWCHSDAGDTMLSTGEPEWVWYAACQYKQKEIEKFIKDHPPDLTDKQYNKLIRDWANDLIKKIKGEK